MGVWKERKMIGSKNKLKEKNGLEDQIIKKKNNEWNKQKKEGKLLCK